MTPQHLLTNHRDKLEVTAKHFGISVEQAAIQIADELTLREARRGGASDWAVDMARAVPTNLIRDIVGDNRAPTGPSAQGIVPSSQQLSSVRTGGNGNGHVVPLSNPPGVNYADRLMDAQDARDRAELIERDAKLQVLQRMAERSVK
jgi:hypothetical protein